MFVRSMPFVSRAGEKLAHALAAFRLDPTGLTCADFGASTGGFTGCLLQHGAAKVYAVETGYGTLDWKLRNDPRAVVMERTNAMHVELPEAVDVVTMDTSWTRLAKILPNALKNLNPDGRVIALVKPHYEAGPKDLRSGKLPDEKIEEVLGRVRADAAHAGAKILQETESPIVGGKGGNREFLWLLEAAG